MKIKTIQNSPEKQKSRQRRLASYQRQFQKIFTFFGYSPAQAEAPVFNQAAHSPFCHLDPASLPVYAGIQIPQWQIFIHSRTEAQGKVIPSCISKLPRIHCVVKTGHTGQPECFSFQDFIDRINAGIMAVISVAVFPSR